LCKFVRVPKRLQTLYNR
jgi:hypothetical protein